MPESLNKLNTIKSHARKVLWLLGMIIVSSFSHAHSPQHVVDTIDISPDYHEDQTAFIIVQNHLLRTMNGGASWKQITNGLDNQFILSSVRFSTNYAKDNTIFVSSDGDGVYKSVDNGSSWAKVNSGLISGKIGLLATYSSSDNNLMILAANTEQGLSLSSNGGASWTTVIQGAKVTAMVVLEHEQTPRFIAGDDNGTLWHSLDRGKSWNELVKLDNAGRITALASSSQRNGFFIGTENKGIYIANNSATDIRNIQQGIADIPVDCGGKTLNIPLTNDYITAIATTNSPEAPNKTFVASWYDGLFVSEEDGDNWIKQNDGLKCDPQADSYDTPVPHFRHIRLSPDFNVDKTLFVAGFDGIFRSTDGGKTWLQLEPLPVSLIRGFDVSPATQNGYSVAVSTYGGGAYISSNKGLNWSINNLGLNTTRLGDITFSPDYQNDNTIFSGAKENILRSENNGRNWQRINIVYKGWRRKAVQILRGKLNVPAEYASDMLLSDAERKRYWPMLTRPSPDYKRDHTVFAGTRRHGVWKSTDNGASWTHDWEGVRDFITALVVSPNYSQDSTIFAAERGHGIHKSSDGGETWQSINKGFKYLETIILPEKPNYNVDQVLFASVKDISLVIAPDYGSSKTLFASSAEGLFKSIDGGDEWIKLDSSPHIANKSIEHVAVSPEYASDQTLFITIKGMGLYVSHDGGAEFSETGHELIEQNHSIKYIKFSPQYIKDSTVFAASEEAVFVSEDSGETWKVLDRPVRYENWRGEGVGPLKYKGNWVREKGEFFSASSISKTSNVGDSVSLHFTGTGVDWIGQTSRAHGIARVLLDGKPFAEIDQYSEETHNQALMLSLSELASGPHVLTISCTGEKNESASNTFVSVDAFDIKPASGPR